MANKSTLQLANLLKIKASHNAVNLSDVNVNDEKGYPIECNATAMASTTETTENGHSLKVNKLLSVLKVSSTLSESIISPQENSEDTKEASKGDAIKELITFAISVLNKGVVYNDWPIKCRRVAEQYSSLGQLVRYHLLNCGIYAKFKLSFQAIASHLVNAMITYQDIEPPGSKFNGFQNRNNKVSQISVTRPFNDIALTSVPWKCTRSSSSTVPALLQ